MSPCQISLQSRLTDRSEERLERDSHNPEVLVPITVDFDVQAESNDPVQANFKIKDRFLWNMNGE